MNARDDGGPAFPQNSLNNIGRGMTLRQYAAIKLCVPNSGTDWLDGMIRQAQRDWFAGQPDIVGSTLLIGKEEGEALAGPRPEGGLEAFRWQCQVLAALRYIAADAMLAERAKAEGGAL